MKSISEVKFIQKWNIEKKRGRIKNAVICAVTRTLPVILVFGLFLLGFHEEKGTIFPEIYGFALAAVIAFIILFAIAWEQWERNEERYKHITGDDS